jgi:capsular polysaccharide biosynthesis protein
VQPQDVLRILIKRGWVLLFAIVVTMASTLIFSRLQTPVYRSTVYLNVWPARLDLSLQQTIRGLMRNYAGTITSREVAMQVVNDLQLDITTEQFRQKITVDPSESDFLIQIDADDYDPLLARDIAQRTAEVFVADIRIYMLDQDQRDRVQVTIIDNALPGRLHKPKWQINMLAGGLFGLLLGGLAIGLAEVLAANTITTVRDIDRSIHLPVLGVVPVTDHEG